MIDPTIIIALLSLLWAIFNSVLLGIYADKYVGTDYGNCVIAINVLYILFFLFLSIHLYINLLHTSQGGAVSLLGLTNFIFTIAILGIWKPIIPLAILVICMIVSFVIMLVIWIILCVFEYPRHVVI